MPLVFSMQNTRGRYMQEIVEYGSALIESKISDQARSASRAFGGHNFYKISDTKCKPGAGCSKLHGLALTLGKI